MPIANVCQLVRNMHGIVPARKIGPDHFAFLRGYVQGVELRPLWERYLSLEGPCDLRVAKRTVTWLRDSLMVAARRASLPHLAAVLRRDASRIPDTDAPLLDDFAARYPQGFYSESELQALWQQEYGAAGQGGRRRQRLIERQLEAIGQLERLLAADPRPHDHIDGWLPENLARRLIAADLTTLHDLVAFVDRHGYRWWTRIERVGAEGAARILQWLQRNEGSLGLALRRTALVPRRSLAVEALQRERARETGIVPLEHFHLPPQLDGGSGTNRGRCNGLPARNDYDAVQAWLAARAPNPHTFRAYRREAERLLIWSVVERGRALSSLTSEDCLAYVDFLAAPAPAHKWCGPRNVERWSSHWRPFEGPLSPRSRQTAITILKSLFEWLTRQHYLDRNPWDGRSMQVASRPGEAANGRPASPPALAERRLTAVQVRFVLEHLETLRNDEANQRRRLALTLAYGSGLCLSELVAARTGHLLRLPLTQEVGDFWVLGVQGGGGCRRPVPVASLVLAHLRTYLEARGLPGDPLACPENTPLIGKLTTGRRRAPDDEPSITANMLYRILKSLFAVAAEPLREGNKEADARRLAAASTRWLRHSSGSHRDDRGASLHHGHGALGQASLNTTIGDAHPDLERAYRDVETMFGEGLVPPKHRIKPSAPVVRKKCSTRS